MTTSLLERRKELAQKIGTQDFWLTKRSHLEKAYEHSLKLFNDTCRRPVAPLSDILPSGLSYNPDQGKLDVMDEDTYKIDCEYLSTLKKVAAEYGMEITITYSTVYVTPGDSTFTYQTMWSNLRSNLMDLIASMQDLHTKEASMKREALLEVLDKMADLDVGKPI